MAAKTLVLKKNSTDLMCSLSLTYKERIGAKVAAEFPGRDPARMRDSLEYVVESIASGVQERFNDYSSAQTKLEQERGDDSPIALERNTAGPAVVSLLVEVRQAADNTDPQLAGKLGFKGDTPREFKAALAAGEFVVTELRTMSPVKSTVLRDYTFKPQSYLPDLEPAVTRLAAAQKAYVLDSRQNDGVMVDRDAKEERNDEGLSMGSRIISALLKAAGEDLLASRLGAPGKESGTLAEFSQPDVPPTPVADEPAA